MKHQQLMDEAHCVWDREQQQAGQFVGLLDVCRALTPAQRIAFVLGELNYQVCNGGWQQWVENGYYELADDTAWALLQINTPATRAVERQLDRVRCLVDLADEEPFDPDDEDTFDALNELDDEYYAVERFMADVEACLHRMTR